MGSHSNSAIQQHVQSSSDLVSKLNQLTEQLQGNLLSDFQQGMGVPFPSVLVAPARILQFDMVYSTDPTVDEYVTGAKSLLDAAFSENYPELADKALDVVANVASKVIGTGNVQAGGQNDSTLITTHDNKTYVSACYSLVQVCSAQDWATQENFYLAYYAFAAWPVPPENVTAFSTLRRA